MWQRFYAHILNVSEKEEEEEEEEEEIHMAVLVTHRMRLAWQQQTWLWYRAHKTYEAAQTQAELLNITSH